jgi:hypothetical protein
VAPTADIAGLPPPPEPYLYPARAYRVSRRYAAAPPSYAFAYGDEQPWVWEAANDDLMFAEPDDTGYRYYYYEPGEAYPYFVQDADYGYAYGDGGALLAVFDAAGALLSADQYGGYGGRARDDWSRGYALEQAYRNSPRYAVQPTVWRERAPAITAPREQWFQAAAAQPAWRQAYAGRGAAAPRDWNAPAPHDNGRHLGWEKTHGGPAHAAAPPPAWREARQPPPRWNGSAAMDAPHGHGGEGHGRGGHEAHAFARQDAPPAFAAAPPGRGDHGGDHGRGPGRDNGADHGGGWGHGHGGDRSGPPAFAQAAPQHGHDAAFHAPQGGQDHGPPGGHGGGDHGNGHGNGGGGGGGQGHGNGGGGGEHGHGGGGHGHH